MSHALTRRRPFVILLLALATGWSSFGCTSMLVTVGYLLYGTSVDPDFPGLAGKKVAVVCRPLVSLQYSNTNVARDLSRQVSQLLQENVKKIKMVDQRKLAKWLDENNWQEYAEVGKAMKADMVVGIDLESFSIYLGQTMYQGNAETALCVYDCTSGEKKVFERVMPTTVYPPSGGIPTSERHEGEFRQEFIRVLANQIGQHFYPHEPHADVGQDALSLHAH